MKRRIALGIVVWSITGLMMAQASMGQDISRDGLKGDKTLLQARDKKFVVTVAQDDMTEVKLGEIARERATSPLLKNFGEQMVRDHGRAADTLKIIASQKSVTMPLTLDAEHQGTVDGLVKLEESQFDMAYLDQMIDAHKNAVRTVTAEQQTTDGELRRWTMDNLPIIQAHLDMALEIKNKIGR